MDLRLAVIGLVVSDMAATLAFYRRLGLDVPAEADVRPHVEVEVGGLRLAFDTEEVNPVLRPRLLPSAGRFTADVARVRVQQPG